MSASTSTTAPTPPSAAARSKGVLKGVPVRIEIGPRDLENGTAVLARRIPGGKEPVAPDDLTALLPKLLEEDQDRPPWPAAGRASRGPCSARRARPSRPITR